MGLGARCDEACFVPNGSVLLARHRGSRDGIVLVGKDGHPRFRPVIAQSVPMRLDVESIVHISSSHGLRWRRPRLQRFRAKKHCRGLAKNVGILLRSGLSMVLAAFGTGLSWGTALVDVV